MLKLKTKGLDFHHKLSPKIDSNVWLGLERWYSGQDVLCDLDTEQPPYYSMF